MCFSTEASFAGGVVIAGIGIAAISKVHKPSQIVFALIPFFFAFQQIVEGFVWLSLQNPDYVGIQRLSTYTFLVMAEVFWPMMIPLAVLLMEENKNRKKILKVLLGMGITLSLYYTGCLFAFQVNPEISGYHIEYAIKYVDNFPRSLELIAFSIYLIASIAPLFVSTVKRTYVLGILMSLSCLMTILFFTQYLTSVWCFFAATISLVIFWILRYAKKKYFSKYVLRYFNE